MKFKDILTKNIYLSIDMTERLKEDEGTWIFKNEKIMLNTKESEVICTRVIK